MHLEVQGVNQELKFNIGFIVRLDEIYKIEQSGIEFSAGLQSAYPQLLMLSVSALLNVVKCALPKAVPDKEIKVAIENYAEENDGLEGLFDGVIAGLKESKITKATIGKLKN